ncbi:leucine-rich repeat domain-containing protein [Acinetobacter sp. ANC 3813]|uniref:leucine-rich repeat domain-containing protein n=1 Tax=Acinetobacter sp. ANC 3813 TaxID=1977873 RepID=UPI00148ABD63|nr:leucine-rich repeat domain-containing protein [Acinetobacter sp. ANC 3813]
MTITSKLANIAAIKSQLKAAIRSKSVSISDALPLSQYPVKIQEIQMATEANIEITYINQASGLMIDVITLKPPCSYLQNYAFAYSKARFINYPSTVKFIGNYAFAYSSSLEFMEFKSTLNTVGAAVLRACTALVEAVCNQPENMLSFEMFYGCTKLKKVTLGPQIKKLGNSCFSGCTVLDTVNTEYLEEIGGSSFSNCSTLINLSFPSLTAITGNYAFSTMSNLESINFGNLANFSSSYMLEKCPKLKKIIFSDKAVTFGNSILYFLTGLKYVEFNALGTMNIANNAFVGMSALEAVVFKSSTPPTLGGTAPFAGYPTAMKIYVPDTAVSAYKAAANWAVLAPYIYPMSEFVMPAL